MTRGFALMTFYANHLVDNPTPRFTVTSSQSSQRSKAGEVSVTLIRAVNSGRHPGNKCFWPNVGCCLAYGKEDIKRPFHTADLSLSTKQLLQ